jgi:hypothetical protein
VISLECVLLMAWRKPLSENHESIHLSGPIGLRGSLSDHYLSEKSFTSDHVHYPCRTQPVYILCVSIEERSLCERDCRFRYRVDSWVYNSFYQSSQEAVDRVVSIIVTRGKLSLTDCCLCGGANHKFAEYNCNLVISCTYHSATALELHVELFSLWSLDIADVLCVGRFFSLSSFS